MFSSESFLILGLVILLAATNWYAVAFKKKWLEYITKPSTLIALVFWFVWTTGFHQLTVWFILGLLLSLAGDIFLMLPGEQFIAGLLSFLLAHVSYSIGFLALQPAINLTAIVLAIVIAITAVQITRRAIGGLNTSGATQLKIPILVYSTVISFMLFTALATLIHPAWKAAPALLVSAGALLFYISDSFLAWNKFVTPLKFAGIMIMITYHLGQIGIALGVALHFLSRG